MELILLSVAGTTALLATQLCELLCLGAPRERPLAGQLVSPVTRSAACGSDITKAQRR